MLVQKIILGLLCAAVVAGLLEYAGRRRAKRKQAAPDEGAPQTAAGADFDTAWKTIVRLFWSVSIGFVLGGLTAGILEELGTGEIEFMSFLANALIAFWTALVWWYVSRRNLI